MAKERKLRGRAKRASYFIQSGTGEYIYQGPLYASENGHGMTPKGAMVRRWCFGIAVAVLEVLAGCLPAPGTADRFYVLVPYAAAIITAARICGKGEISVSQVSACSRQLSRLERCLLNPQPQLPPAILPISS